MSHDPGPLRIGEFGRRVGVSPDLLRAWERRYGLLRPVRSPGGFRLYTAEDAARVSRMRQALGDGLSAAEAAGIALADDPRASRQGPAPNAVARMLASIRAYDEPGVHAVLDEGLAAFGVDVVLRDLVLPTLRQVGLEWQQGTLDVSHEHFASHVLRGRLLALGRLWGRGGGPLALLACAPGEEHDLGLIAFGLVLRSYGWRILLLGADTPVVTLARAVEETRPALTVVTSVEPARLEAEAPALRGLADLVPLVLAGPGASDAVCEQVGVSRLDGDLVAAAGDVAAGYRFEKR
ncbi:MAG TPA: MerR family transcriptional regulator [Solirubrobacteraceae bacterium]|nr:MerR family transcriptional regulator [Solirubrobacteraceae bacterium]